MNLKSARELARKVGATIEEKKRSENMTQITEYIVRLGVIKIEGNGGRQSIVLHASSPHEAADLAVVETGRACRALLEHCKQVYTDSDLIFGAPKA